MVSSQLGNTPTVALESYINPTVFAPWESLAVDLETKADAEEGQAKTYGNDGGKALREFCASVSYAGNIRPEMAPADEDDDAF